MMEKLGILSSLLPQINLSKAINVDMAKETSETKKKKMRGNKQTNKQRLD